MRSYHLQKLKIVKNPEKDLRPISFTLCVSKVAEEFVVDKHVKPAVLEMIDQNQYGVIPKSPAIMALIYILHQWYLETDGNGSVIGTILFDDRKAFDFIDYSILIISQLDPQSVVNWIIDFLTNRLQRINLGSSCLPS